VGVWVCNSESVYMRVCGIQGVWVWNSGGVCVEFRGCGYCVSEWGGSVQVGVCGCW